MRHRTAIKRKAISKPMRWLKKYNLIHGRSLDYGCGHGFDADAMGMEKYDPHFFPTKPTGKYDVITCIYVINVIDNEKDRMKLLKNIRRLLAKNGYAYIVTRTRKEIEEDHYTKYSTYQGYHINELLANKAFVLYKDYQMEIWRIP